MYPRSSPLADPAFRIRRARIAALSLHGKYDSNYLTTAAREAAFSKFLKEADPGGVLPEQERQRRAKSLQRAHLLRIADKSVRSRQQRAARRGQNGGVP